MLRRFAIFLQSLVKYGLVGVLTVATQAAIYLLLAQYFRFEGLISYAVAVLSSLVITYFGQSRWTFADRKSRSVVRYAIVVAGMFCLGSIGTWLIVDSAKFPPAWALPLMVILIPFMSFLLLRHWVFRHTAARS